MNTNNKENHKDDKETKEEKSLLPILMRNVGFTELFGTYIEDLKQSGASDILIDEIRHMFWEVRMEISAMDKAEEAKSKNVKKKI